MLAALVLLAVTLTGAGLLLAQAWSRASAQAAQFKPVPGVRGLLAAVPAGVDLGRVGAVVDRAASMLVGRGLWPRYAIDRALDRARLIVSASDSWQDSSGLKVGGLTTYAGMEVDRHLGATLHELAHLMEIADKGAADVEHATWTARGIWAADNDFRAWLEANP